jgi:acyl carrier protein phosphodiesterase
MTAIIQQEYPAGAVNYLAHLYLADHTGTSLAGSLMGDVVRGPLEGRYPLAIEQGIRLHRRVDSFTDSHPVVRAARTRLQSPYRRYAGILLDVFFDHCLALQWEQFHAEPLEQFVGRAHRVLLREGLRLAHPGFVLRLSYMRSRNLLLSYRGLDGVERALQGLSARLSRENPLASGLDVLQPQYSTLENDFRLFFPELVRFAEAEIG